MTANNGRNRTLAEADLEAIRGIVNDQLFGLEFTEHLTSIIDGSLDEKLKPIRIGLHQAGEGLIAAGAEPAKENSP